MIKVFKHGTHTAYEIRKRSVNKKGIVIIKKTGNKFNIKTLLHFWQFSVHKWFVIIRTPFFVFENNNSGFVIGHPNCYLWVIS